MYPCATLLLLMDRWPPSPTPLLYSFVTVSGSKLSFSNVYCECDDLSDLGNGFFNLELPFPNEIFRIISSAVDVAMLDSCRQ